MYRCANCGGDRVFWQSSFDFEDYGLDEEGVVNEYYCPDCGASITYYCPFKKEEEDEDGKQI